MRSFSLADNKKALDVLYKILTVLFAVLFSFLTIGTVSRCVNVKYLYPLKFRDEIKEISERFNLEQSMVYSIIKIESDFNSDAISEVGAVGLMQIMPETAEYIASMIGQKDYDLKDEYTNIAFGCCYLAYLMRRFNNIETCVCAYNAGEGNVSFWLVNPEYSDDSKTLKFIPFPETREYIKKFNQTFTKYKKLYRNILDKR